MREAQIQQFWESRWARGVNGCADASVIPILKLLMAGGRFTHFEIPDFDRSGFRLPGRIIDLGSGQESPSRILREHTGIKVLEIDYGGGGCEEQNRLRLSCNLDRIQLQQAELRDRILEFFEIESYQDVPLMFLATYILRYIDFKRLLREIIPTMSKGSSLLIVDDASLLKDLNVSDVNPQGPDVPCNHPEGLRSIQDLVLFLENEGFWLSIFINPNNPSDFKLIAVK